MIRSCTLDLTATDEVFSAQLNEMLGDIHRWENEGGPVVATPHDEVIGG